MTQKNEWYQDGLAFECTLCGNCCTGAPGFVWFEAADGTAMAEKLGVDETQFYRLFARKINGRWSLREQQTPQGLDCVFLDREKVPGKAVCRVYEARPMQCKTWPFWPENLASRKAWEQTGRTCPGLNQGATVPIEQIRIQRDETPAD